VACLVSCLILLGNRGISSADTEKEQKDEVMPMRMEHAKIYFVCDVGMGSSAMASALFKKRLKLEGLMGIEVFHVSADRIPADADAVVCQKDFARTLPQIHIPCFTVDNLTDMSGYKELLNWLMGGG
jgi:PTS system mannitol-specific IIC component